MFVRSTAPILGSTGETRQSQGLASTLSTRESAKQRGLITLRVSREVIEMFGFLVPVGAREYLPLNSSINFYLKELTHEQIIE